MKNFKFKTIGKYFFYAVLTLVFISCQNNQVQEAKFYTYKTKIEVKYVDNTKDTIFNTIKLHKDVSLSFTLKTSEPTFWGAEKIVPCLTLKHDWGEENLACDVKTFRILAQTKTPYR